MDDPLSFFASFEFVIVAVAVAAIFLAILLVRRGRGPALIYYVGADPERAKTGARRNQFLRALLCGSSLAAIAALAFASTMAPRGFLVDEPYVPDPLRHETVIVLDASGSMSDNTPRREREEDPKKNITYILAQDAVLRTIGGRPDHAIGFVLYATKSFTAFLPLMNRLPFVEVMRENFLTLPFGVDINDSTEGSLGVARAAGMLLQRPGIGEKHIVVISDLSDGSKDKFRATLKAAREDGIAIDLVHIEITSGDSETKQKIEWETFARENDLGYVLVNALSDAEALGPRVTFERRTTAGVILRNQVRPERQQYLLVGLGLTLAVVLAHLYVRRPYLLIRPSPKHAKRRS